MDRSFETRTYETDHTNTNDLVHRDNRRAKPSRRKAVERANTNLSDQPILTQAEIDFLLHS